VRNTQLITTSWWPKKSWHAVLKKLEIGRRKFYATRHTFISWVLTQGMNLTALREYVGTSVAMIERSYGRYVSDRGLSPVLPENRIWRSGSRPGIDNSVDHAHVQRYPPRNNHLSSTG